MPGPLSIPNGRRDDKNTQGGEKRAEFAQRRQLDTGKTRVVKKIEPRWNDPSRRPRRLIRD